MKPRLHGRGGREAAIVLLSVAVTVSVAERAIADGQSVRHMAIAWRGNTNGYEHIVPFVSLSHDSSPEHIKRRTDAMPDGYRALSTHKLHRGLRKWELDKLGLGNHPDGTRITWDNGAKVAAARFDDFFRRVPA